MSVISKDAEVNLEFRAVSEGMAVVMSHLGPSDSWEHRFVIDMKNIRNLREQMDIEIKLHERIWGDEEMKE